MPTTPLPPVPQGHELYMILGKLDAKLDGVTGEIKGLKDDIKQLREDVNKDIGAIEGRVLALEKELADRPQLKKQWEEQRVDIANLKDLVSQTKGGLTTAKVIFGIAGAIPVGILVYVLSILTGNPQPVNQHPAPQAQVQKVQ